MRHPSKLFVVTSALVVLGVAHGILGAELERLLDPRDLPPAPKLAPASTLTHSQQETRQVQGGLVLNSESTNLEERELARKIIELKTRLAEAEGNAYREDPALHLCDLYAERAHDWVMQKHNAEFNAYLRFKGPADPAEAKNWQRRYFDLVRLVDAALFQELGKNTNFAPLFQAAFDSFELVRRQHPDAMAEQYRYDRIDALIGYPTESPAPRVNSLAEYLVELDKRYPHVLARLAEVRAELAVPPDAFEGIKLGELYRMLDGFAHIVVEIRTPKEIRELREELRRKVIELANLPRQPETPPAAR